MFKKYSNILFLFLIIFLGFVAFVLANFLPNQLAWKIYNKKGIEENNLNLKEKYFSQANKKYSQWKLAIKNNQLDTLYQKKEYKVLEKKINNILNNECSIKKQKEISEWCENIFYLNGLVKYRLGEQKKDLEQQKFFKEAIFNFQKSLKINPKNRWAQENIKFILNKLKKDKSKKNTKNNQQKTKQENNQQNSNFKNNKKQNNNNKAKQKNNQNKNQKRGKSNLQSKNNQVKNNNSSAKSRLPQSIQKALKKREKELDKNQEKQIGFSRSKEQAKMNQERFQSNPFANDPFFKAFFGNDPFFNQVFNNRKKNFRKNISNSDEKDW